jgi:hypothetical protein
MNMDNFIRGITILQAYFDQPDGYHIGAEHDQFYIYPTDQPLTALGVKELFAIGWFQPDAEDTDVYDPEQGWSAYV